MKRELAAADCDSTSPHEQLGINNYICSSDKTIERRTSMMEATDREDLIQEANEDDAPPNGVVNEMFDVGQEDQEGDMQEQMEEFLGPQPEYNEEEEEKKYYRRKRLGVIKNVLSASVAAMLVYGVYMGLLQMQLILHYDMMYREVKYSNLGLEDIDQKMMMGINVTPIIGLLYTPLLIRFLGTKWMMFLASGIYALFVSTNYWERYYTLVPSAVAIGAAIVPLWASLGHYMTRMAQQYYEYVNYKEEHVQEQKKLPKGACHSYIIVFHSVFHIIFNLSFVFAQLPCASSWITTSLTTPHTFSCKVESCGANVSGWIPGFNTSVLSSLPRSMLLIEVESVLMGFAFLAMIMFLVLCGPAYRPTEEIDLRSIGWGNIFQLPFKHHRDYRLRLLCPFFIYSGFEVLFVVSGFSLVKGYRYLEEDNSDESDSDNSDDDDDDDDDDYDREDETEDDEYVPGEEDDRRYKGDLDGGARGHDSPKGQRRRRQKEDRRERRRRDGEDGERHKERQTKGVEREKGDEREKEQREKRERGGTENKKERQSERRAREEREREMKRERKERETSKGKTEGPKERTKTPGTEKQEGHEETLKTPGRRDRKDRKRKTKQPGRRDREDQEEKD
ncbi:hypothetical protein WMY93_006101 [Mugilogobius chulae]|uniref:Protein unc-93 homolog B1 n=1 Tax=Mugilogobius chulae TaxID=88201 RepID=A0AAW0PLG5_9GOBI